jgi:chromosomal replication initiation ATPase DnaA
MSVRDVAQKPGTQQLGLPFIVRPALGRDDFFVAPSNENAFRFIERWPDWPARVAALHGPEGAGKSHLVAVWRSASGAELLSARDLSLETIASLPSAKIFAVEDVDAGPPTLERDRALLALFERSSALLLSGRSAPARWQASIGDLGSRFRALVGLEMGPPDDTLLGNVARKLFADRGVLVSDAVVGRMLRALERNPPAIAAFIERTDRQALAEGRPVNERLVSELLGG